MSGSPRCPYKILGVSESADEDDILEKFESYKIAFEFLMDAQKRRAYDREKASEKEKVTKSALNVLFSLLCKLTNAKEICRNLSSRLSSSRRSWNARRTKTRTLMTMFPMKKIGKTFRVESKNGEDFGHFCGTKISFRLFLLFFIFY
jgi:DnaJ-class molecular chaperone